MFRLTHMYMFLAVVSGFISLLSVVACSFMAVAFSVYEPHSLRVLYAGVLGLSLSFVCANIIGNYFYNFLTRAYYWITAVWLGFVCHLFISAVVYTLVMYMSGGVSLIVGKYLFLLGALVTFYGLLHARNIRIKKITVALPNTPHQWRTKSVVWVSDLHAGQVYGTKFLRRVVDKINSIAPEMVFIGGDLFDGTQAPDLGTLISPLAYIDNESDVYFITGNHEEFRDSSPFLRSIRELGIRVLTDEMIEVDGMQIIGVDYRNAADPVRFKAILSSLSLDRAKPSILLKHEPKDLDVAEEGGVSFQLSGHTHKAQFWPLLYIARAIYKGYEYGLKRYKNMLVYTSSGVGGWGPPMRVGSDSEIVHITFE